MTKTGQRWVLWMAWIPLACSSKNAMKLSPGGDAGTLPGDDAAFADSSTITPDDGRAMLPDSVLPPDLALAPDVFTGTPDMSKADSASPAADITPDLRQGGDLAAIADGTLADGKLPPADVGPVFYADGKLPPEDINPVFFLDGKMLPDAAGDMVKADAAKDRGPESDVGILVSGVQVLPSKDYEPADATCVQGTASWVTSLTTYLAEDRKCWTDADCQYVSFTNSCGQVCPVPMNVQRIGEFAQHAIGDLDPKCSTCPVLTDPPSCSPPPGDGSVICNNSLCSWK
jgi:hypothetical protein